MRELWEHFNHKTPLKDTHYLSKTCKRGHGFNGYTIRRKSNGSCVFCEQIKRREYAARRMQRGKPKSMVCEIARKREELELERELREIDGF